MNKINHESILMVVKVIKDAISSTINRNNQITPEIKVYTTHLYVATRKRSHAVLMNLEYPSRLSAELSIKP